MRTPSSNPASRNRVGAVSLVAAVSGAATCHLLTSTGLVADSAWLQVVRAGFEAATVGGLADWFAVTALFRHPLGVPVPHTAIIRKRRTNIIESIVEVFEDEWLSPGVIEGRVARLHPGEQILGWLRDPERVKAVDVPLRDVLRGISRVLTEREVVEHVDRLLRSQLGGFPINGRAGTWLDRAAASPTAEALFEAVVRSLADAARQPRMEQRLRAWMDHSAQHMEESGRHLLPFLLRTEAVQHKVADSLSSYLATELEYSAVEANHPLREAFFDAAHRFAEKLEAGDHDALDKAEHVRRALIENIGSDPLSGLPLAELQGRLEAELDRPDSPAMDQVVSQIRDLALRLLSDPANLAAFEAWVKKFAVDLVNRYHHQIGLTLRESLEAIDTDTLVTQIEERLGPDLQYIRLNGAVVGGLIGVLLAVARLILT